MEFVKCPNLPQNSVKTLILGQKYAEFLQERMGQSDWQVAPIDWEHLRPVRMAGGRVYRIDNADSEAPISTTAGGSVFSIQPYLAKIDNRWLIVR